MCCACADVSDFKNRNVKIFLLKICSEYQNLVEKLEAIYYVKCVQIRSFFCPYFLAFGLNMERYEVSLRFSPNAGKYGS